MVIEISNWLPLSRASDQEGNVKSLLGVDNVGLGTGYTSVYICENSLQYLLKMSYFIVCTVHFILPKMFQQSLLIFVYHAVGPINKSVYSLHSFWKDIRQYLAGAVQMPFCVCAKNSIPVFF